MVILSHIHSYSFIHNKNFEFFFSFQLSNPNTNFDERIAFSIKFYVGIGCASLVFNYLASICWSTASERQTRRIRYI